LQLEVEIPLLVVLIGLSGFFSGLEVALVGIRMAKVEQMVKD
jgi:CBS domain containing-hemolysin-like protein